MDDFEQEMKSAFLEEAAQNLADAEQCFLTLEANSSDSALLEKIFRLAHNLKGSANAVGFQELGEFTHEMESFLLKLKSGELPVNAASIDLLLRCNDHLNQFIQQLKVDPQSRRDSHELIREFAVFSNATAPAPMAAEPSAAKPSVAKDVPDFPLPEATDADFDEDIPSPAVTLPLPVKTGNAADHSPSKEPDASVTRDESIRVSLARLEKLLNYVGEMVVFQAVLNEQVHSIDSPLMRKTVHQLGKVSKEIQDISMSLRMVPLRQTSHKLQRIVRDTSKALGKQVRIVVTGEDTELDKTVLEQISDPLVHLIRNAVDHGLESPDERKTLGKNECGTISLNAYHKLGQIIIEVVDDGRGLNAAHLIRAAQGKGLVKPGENLTDEQAYRLIFAPGFSTKSTVSDVSGRGVGMDVVKTNIEALRGDVQIETTLGKGTTFRIRLPVSLAIIEGMIVKGGSERFVIPINSVFEDVDASEMVFEKRSGLGEVLLLRGENMPLYRLSGLLGRKSDPHLQKGNAALVIRSGPSAFAVVVDQVLGQQQVVIKPLSRELSGVKGFGGTAILGDGLPALILELPELVRKRGVTTQKSVTGMGGVAA